ncbi:thioredoxin domain-containing protein [Methylococcus geothermalis]|uniref:Uncharacterized protein n=1 Tax=Methylococcus geothermalis TaxID=2681310 RepID=A0A858Q451_9GAMM|nr:hypothetical protein [Methylococcus geothermalis]QJD28619.1 hypothetical protein GNH96_00645 [Methylococcus geothermalis]
MTADRRVTLFHASSSRSTGTFMLPEELAEPTTSCRFSNLTAGEQHEPGFLADLDPESGRAPPIGDPLRGP